ncbi:hypothetical protein V6N12_054367 [Hibiscus sabdariffa]|uniref:Protein kinase domain-containing protein n=1 Tax=Hibiscus sabdariffa TaxID=183260 RepID=A0ABR2D0W8_9ROSI
MSLKGLTCIAVVTLLTAVCLGRELHESKSFHRNRKFEHAYKYSEEPIALQRDGVLNVTGQDETAAGPPGESSEDDSNKLLVTLLPWLHESEYFHRNRKFEHVYKNSEEPIALQRDGLLNVTGQDETAAGPPSDSSEDDSNKLLVTLLPLFIGFGLFCVFLYCMSKRGDARRKENGIPMALKEPPRKLTPVNAVRELSPEGRHQQLVFFAEDNGTFKLDDLLDASADLQSQSSCTSFYKVVLKNKATYAVKRLKNLQVSFQEFDQTMRWIGNLKHRNILPLVGYRCTNDEKLLFYKYQSNGSLLNLLQGYIDGKNEFPWRLRLAIARGIAGGLAFIYQSFGNQESIPHGNLKLSNVLLSDNMEPLISEYGISRLLDPKQSCLFSSNGNTAPEKFLSERGDVFSFGIILLQLLTGKTVEKTGVDLPKWVGSMVREEWTGEVFDKDVPRAAMQWAFPLLNIALKCVSHSPQDRPTTAEVVQLIDEALHVYEDRSVSSMSSLASGQPECCMLHSVIPETWDTPGSNY